MQTAIETVVLFLQREIPSLVCCGAGMSRSPAVIAAALSVFQGGTPDDRLRQIAIGHPHDISPQLWEDVRWVCGNGEGASMSSEFNLNCPVPLSDHATVQMANGGGGRLMRNLIEGVFFPAFNGELPHGPQSVGVGEVSSSLSPLPFPLSSPPHDSAVLPTVGQRLAFTTDSFVVNPLFFPGGDIGTLAICGTVNDLAMAGARPAYLSAGFILEEGLPMETLRRIVASMAETARAVSVRIVTGDTKVVDRGKADGIFINTAGIGWLPEGVEISPARVQPGDAILLSGDLGRHGMAIMSVREGLRFEGALESDCAPLNELVEAMLAADADVHCLRDLTRGGLAAALERNRAGRLGRHRDRGEGDSGGRTGGGGL